MARTEPGVRSSLVPFAIPAALAAGMLAIYNRLPTAVETHFALDGTPNGTMPRAVFAISGPVLAAVLVGLAYFRRPADTLANTEKDTLSDSREARDPRTHLALALCISALLVVAVQSLLAARALGLASLKPMPLVLALFLVGLGLLLPKIPRNRFVGIRTAATLADPERWAQANRRGGNLYVIAGFIGIFGAFFAPTLAMPIVAGAILVATVGALVLARA